MSLQYLLDGYNITHQMPGLSQKTLEEQRQALIHFVEHKRPQGSVKNSVTVVFDGQPGVSGPLTSSAVTVVFTKHQSADDKIVGLVEEAKVPQNIRVVTDDRSVKYAIRALGAQPVSVKEFLGKRAPGPGVAARPAEQKVPEKYISQTKTFEINTELSDIWLKKKKRK